MLLKTEEYLVFATDEKAFLPLTHLRFRCDFGVKVCLRPILPPDHATFILAIALNTAVYITTVSNVGAAKQATAKKSM